MSEAGTPCSSATIDPSGAELFLIHGIFVATALVNVLLPIITSAHGIVIHGGKCLPAHRISRVLDVELRNQHFRRVNCGSRRLRRSRRQLSPACSLGSVRSRH
jgi:hypothetical protein